MVAFPVVSRNSVFPMFLCVSTNKSVQVAPLGRTRSRYARIGIEVDSGRLSFDVSSDRELRAQGSVSLHSGSLCRDAVCYGTWIARADLGFIEEALGKIASGYLKVKWPFRGFDNMV